MFNWFSQRHWISFLDFLAIRIKMAMQASLSENRDDWKKHLRLEVDTFFFGLGMAYIFYPSLDYKSSCMHDLVDKWKDVFLGDQGPEQWDFTPLTSRLHDIPTFNMPYAWWESDEKLDSTFDLYFAAGLWECYLGRNPQLIPGPPLISPTPKLLELWTECKDELQSVAEDQKDQFEDILLSAIPAVAKMRREIVAASIYPIIEFSNHTARPFNPNTFCFSDSSASIV
ncbi:hypothetical protein BKA70DRAFT_1447740 [Coprinopsis sp. MPI-PUGE-AT-0042]|nr:hypothetical protein BKA70DRAFT_1447740 [Coprinopsis sp. MPI-PUGE-AT-0042]